MVAMMMNVSKFSTSGELTISFGVVPKIREFAETSHNRGTTHHSDGRAVFVHVLTVEDSVVHEDVQLSESPREGPQQGPNRPLTQVPHGRGR